MLLVTLLQYFLHGFLWIGDIGHMYIGQDLVLEYLFAAFTFNRADEYHRLEQQRTAAFATYLYHRLAATSASSAAST